MTKTPEPLSEPIGPTLPPKPRSLSAHDAMKQGACLAITGVLAEQSTSPMVKADIVAAIADGARLAVFDYLSDTGMPSVQVTP